MRGSIKILFLISCFTTQLLTQEVTLYRVNVVGNQTTSDKMVKYSAGLRDGTQIQRSDITTAVTRLWDLGLFDDISISLNNESQYGVEITINVVESPVLNNFRFDGITIRENRLKDKLLLKQGQRIKPNSTDQSIRIIENIYKNDGYFNVDVNANIVAPKDTVVRTQFSKDILFEIKENKKFRLKNINFIGNQNFSDRQLKKEINTKEKRWWTFWVKSYDQESLEEDLKNLKDFYNNEGYRDFRVLSNDLEVKNHEGTLTLNINIVEGEKYFYRNFKFEDNRIAKDEELLRLLNLNSGDVFSQESFDKAVYEDMMSIYQDRGYIFSSVNPQVTPVGSDSLDVFFKMDEGNQVFIDQILISGNEKTRENVIRRELKIYPGDIFNRSKLMRSQRDIWILNYFDNVIPDVIPVSEDKVNLDFLVEEKQSTQRINANLGFTGEYGVTGGAGVEFDNFRGKGQSLSVGLSTGTNFSLYTNQEPSKYRSFNLGFQDPMINDSPYLVGVSLFYSFRGSSTNYFFPLDFTVGGAVASFGRRLEWPDDFFRVMWSVKYMQKQYEGSQEDINQYIGGLDKTRGISISQSFSRDSRNRAEFPTNGSTFTLNSTLSGGILGGNENFQKHLLSLEWFTPTYSKFILYSSAKIGIVKPISVANGEQSFIPFDERFIMGGNGIPYGNALRGYPDNAIGPQTTSGQAVGGNSMGKIVAELRYPLSENPVIYFMAFGEMGNVWNTSRLTEPFYIDRFSSISMKKSAGIGVRFFMPGLGKLGFDMGYGFDDITGDGNPQGWEYTITFGQTF